MTRNVTTKNMVTMPTVTWQEVRSRVGPRGISEYVAAAVARQLERDALDELLASMEVDHGAVSEADLAAVLAVMSP